MDIIGGQHFERTGEGGLGKRMRVDPQEQRPAIPFCLRYSQIACVTARMCHSLNARLNDDPRWPDVPNETRCAGNLGSGRSA